MVTESQFLDQGFSTGNPGIVRLTDSLKLGFPDRKLRNCWGDLNTKAGFLNGNPNFKAKDNRRGF